MTWWKRPFRIADLNAVALGKETPADGLAKVGGRFENYYAE